MYRVKTPRDAKGLIDLKTQPTTTSDAMFKKPPSKTNRNIRHGHLIQGMREINRIGWKPEEKAIADFQRLIERRRWEKHTRFYFVLERSQTLLQEVRRGEEELQATNEELQATTEELERINAYHQLLMDSMRDILMTTDPAGTITDINPVTERISGYSHAELVSKPFRQFFTEPERAQAGIEQVLAVGEVKDYDLTLVTKDERHVSVSYNATVLRDPKGQITGVLGSARDITRRKEYEEEIKELNEDLERRAAQLEAVNKELEAFSYSVSHDLRAPLRGMDGFSQVLLEDYADRLDAAGKDHLRRIRESAQRMAELIDALLKLSGLTRSEMRYEAVDLSALARTIVAELQQRQPERQAEFVIPEGLVANGDEQLLRVVLENLLGNAWKFTGKETRARIEFAVTEHQGKPAYFVRDNGVGFDMTYVKKLFGPFQRLHGATEFPGIGIGLATVKRIIGRHGGVVWAEGTQGQGATFYFTL